MAKQTPNEFIVHSSYSPTAKNTRNFACINPKTVEHGVETTNNYLSKDNFNTHKRRWAGFVLLCLVGVALTLSACNDDNGSGGNKPHTLAGTKWQLTAFVDVENNTIKKPNYYPVGNIRCNYTLSFDDDTLVTGVTCVNQLRGSYIANYEVDSVSISVVSTKASEFGDGQLYYYSLCDNFHFKLFPKALHLYYNEGKERLEFKRIGG